MGNHKRVGILTAGGDCPGLNAAIRGFGKAAIREYGMELVGFHDGFLGLAQNRYVDPPNATSPASSPWAGRSWEPVVTRSIA